MPGKVKVKILSGRNLPVMDRSSDTTDAYVEVKLGTTTFKTDVCRKSLNPQWNSEWYRFELDDAELQDEPLQIRIMDHDTYSANDAIGKVYIDLNPLLLPQSAGSNAKNSDSLSSITSSSGGSVMSGWFPVYDTMHGIRGEVNVIVKVDLFTDFNKFRQSSCGVQFFNSGVVPQGYTAQIIHGFVEELVVSDDPEYQWIEKIRTPRASNEARQTTFFKLSGEVQRKIGLKVLELGGNCVIGYHQVFDLEGESGIVVRGIGTAVTLVRTLDSGAQQPPGSAPPQISLLPYSGPTPTLVPHEEVLREPPDDADGSYEAAVAAPGASTPSKLGITAAITRRSSESDLSITPKGNSLAGSGGSSGGFGGARTVYTGGPRSAAMFKENLDMLEYPFLTMSKYPPGFILRVGGTVRANSVKLLERMTNLEEPESRDAWWTELRLEVRSHARALACNVVLGYSEHTAICDDVCVLSASGTAAVINVCLGNSLNSTSSDAAEKFSKLGQNGAMSDSPLSNLIEHKPDNLKQPISRPRDNLEMPLLPCRFCHVPYNEVSVPFKVNLIKCAVCKKGKVPDLIFATIDPPDSVPITGSTCFIQAFVSRSKRDCKGELNAKEISDGLPFLEYELHRQLMNKLTVKGMNALFGLKVQKCIGERTLAAYATATAVYLSPLPAPALPKVTAGDAWKDGNTIAEMQRMLQDCVNENKEFFRLRRCSEGDRLLVSDSDESEEEILPDIDLNAGGKDTCILEMDDAEDISVVSQLVDPHPPQGFHVSSIETLPGLDQLEVVKNLQMFTQVWRSRVPSTTSVNKHFQRLLQTMYYKLRRMTPCAIAKLSFHIDIPEPEEVQLSVVGMALGLGEVDKSLKSYRRRLLSSHSKDLTKDDGTTDLIFRLDEDQNEASSSPASTGRSPDDKPLSSIRPPLVQLSRSPDDKAPSSTKPYLSQLRGVGQEKGPSVSVEDKEGKTSALFTSHTPPKEHYGVDITPLSYIAGGRIERYLGNLNFFFIRESNCIRESGGLSGFVHSFVTEVLAILRAHVTALGGNAMVSYTMTHCILLNNQGKNQGQCLINVGGDVVFVSYPSQSGEERD